MRKLGYALLLLLLAACGDGTVTVRGAAQKGPFIVGSSIAVSPVDDRGQPVGSVYRTETNNDRGEFSVTLPDAGLVSIEGDGYYYNEITGALSAAPGTLRAFADASAGAPIHLNLVTHLSYARIRNLLEAGLAFPVARAQAERELRVALQIGPIGYDPGAGDGLDLLGGDTDANAYLFTVSAAVILAAVEREGVSLEAALQELDNTISRELAEDGVLDESTSAALMAAQRALDDPSTVLAIMEALGHRFADLGVTTSVPDLNRMLDADGDGLVNASDNCPFFRNADQADADGDGHGDPCPIANLELTDGNDQDGAAGETLNPFRVVVRDRQANAVPGVTVQFTIAAGDGSLSATSGVSDARGQASVRLTLGAKRYATHVITASAPGVPPVTFRATTVVGYASKEISIPGATRDVIVGDVNSDGLTDLITSNGETGNSVAVLVNRTPQGANVPTFASVSSIAVDSPGALALGDLDGDGRPDLVVGHGWSSAGVVLTHTISIFANASTSGGPASFVPSLNLPALSDSCSPTGCWIRVVDLDGDGRLDIVTGRTDHDRSHPGTLGDDFISVFLNTTTAGSPPTFGARTDVRTGSLIAATIVDFNQDGRPDILVETGGPVAKVLSVLVNSTQAHADAPMFSTTALVASNELGVGTIATGDVNLDGAPDVVISAPYGSLAYYRNTTQPGSATPTLGAAQRLELIPPLRPSHLLRPLDVTLADTDGNGHLDIVMSNSGGVAVINNTGEAGLERFEPWIDYALPNSDTGGISVGDFNRDGKIDLVVVHPDSGLSVLLGS